MDTGEHIEHLERESTAFAEILGQDGLDLGARVPTCPEWTVRDLAEHVGGLYRWVTVLVGEGIVAETWRRELPLPYPASDAEVVPWFVESAGQLLATVASAPPDRPVWVWGADPHARFWPRRMLHETLVHRFDLETASGGEVGAVPSDLAVDGIDEFLTNLPGTARWGAPLDRLRGEGQTLSVVAADSGHRWRIRFEPSGWWWDRADGPADAELAGPVGDLYLSLQGRERPSVRGSGDGAILDRWRGSLDF